MRDAIHRGGASGVALSCADTAFLDVPVQGAGG
jgi:hypothetical protein